MQDFFCKFKKNKVIIIAINVSIKRIVSFVSGSKIKKVKIMHQHFGLSWILICFGSFVEVSKVGRLKLLLN